MKKKKKKKLRNEILSMAMNNKMKSRARMSHQKGKTIKEWSEAWAWRSLQSAREARRKTL